MSSMGFFMLVAIAANQNVNSTKDYWNTCVSNIIVCYNIILPHCIIFITISCDPFKLTISYMQWRTFENILAKVLIAHNKWSFLPSLSTYHNVFSLLNYKKMFSIFALERDFKVDWNLSAADFLLSILKYDFYTLKCIENRSSTPLSDFLFPQTMVYKV